MKLQTQGAWSLTPLPSGLSLLLMCPAFSQVAPLCTITRALDVIAATAITAAAVVVNGDHIVPEEVVLTADTTGVTPGGSIPMTHHDHDHLDDTATGHDPAEGIDPTTGVGLNPWEGILVFDPILQIVNIPGMLQSLKTGSDIEQVEASIPSHEPITDQVAKIVCS